MRIFSRIAQMESSRIVGGRAQTQALLRAPDQSRNLVMSFETLSRRPTATGNPQSAGAHGDNYASPVQMLPRTINHAPAAVNNSTPMVIQSSALIPFPSRSILAAPIPGLEPINLAKARLNKSLLFALLLSLALWGVIAAGVWLLFFSRF